MIPNNLIIALKRIRFKAFLPYLFLFLPFFQLGCIKPLAALSFINKDSQINHISTKTIDSDDRAVLDISTEKSIKRYGPIIQKYSDRYDLDWRFVLAVMRHESKFHPSATSNRGAFGLMQLMPETQSELAEKIGIEETASPYNNIRAGTFHLRSLYRMFYIADRENRLRLTLAAYNAGLRRIMDAQEIVSYLGDNPNSWDDVRAALPLLSKRYYTLHQSVWETGKPPGGYFSDWRQTQSYVETIMEYYEGYQLALR